MTVEHSYYWFAGLGLFSVAAVTLGLLIYDKLKHQCPFPPPINDEDYVYFRGRHTVRVDGKKAKVCVFQHSFCGTSYILGGFSNYTDGRITCVRCRDKKIVQPDGDKDGKDGGKAEKEKFEAFTKRTGVKVLP